MNRFGPSYIDDQRAYVITSLLCSLVPTLTIAVLPEPWHSSLLPIAVLFGSYAFFYAGALALYVIEAVWRILRPATDRTMRCPTCHTPDQPHRPFFVARVGPHVLRVHCPECHERWFERQPTDQIAHHELHTPNK